MRTTFSAAALIAAHLLLTQAAFAQCGLTMSSATAFPLASPRCTAMADLNGDGILDILAASFNAGQIVTFRGNGDGTFVFAGQAPTVQSPSNIVTGDFNGDGRPDVAILGASGATPLGIKLNNCPAACLSAGASYTCIANPSGLAAGDFNEDGVLDLVCTGASGTANVIIYRGAGNGTFVPGAAFASGGSGAVGIVIADFNADSHLDLAIANQSTHSVTVLTGDGAGAFSLYATISGLLPVGPGPIATGDFNLDGLPDFFVQDASSTSAAIILNSGAGFASPQGFAFAFPSYVVRVADVNGDGLDDLIGSSMTSNSVVVHPGWGDGTFGPPSMFATGTTPWGVAAGDLNGDGVKDLAVTCLGGNTVQRFLTTITTMPGVAMDPVTTSVIAGQPATFSVTATGGNLTYRWRRNYQNLPNSGPFSGANSPTLTINPTTLADNLAMYDVIITNACGTVTSRMAVLGVDNCPGDFNNDGNVDFFDYLDFVDAFSTGC